MQATGPFSRFVSANMAKEEIMEYLAQSRRRGVSLRHNKEEKLEEESLRFLKQSGGLCVCSICTCAAFSGMCVSSAACA